MQEIWIQSLAQEDPLEKGMGTNSQYSSILAWRIPQTEEPGGLYSPLGLQRDRHDWATNTHITFLIQISFFNTFMLLFLHLKCWLVPI